MPSTKTAIVIGAGVGGLTCAAYLAKSGYKVTVFEKNNQLGGRAGILKSHGFTFDMGPSWYLMPDIWEKLYADFGYKPSDFLKLKRLDPSYRIYFGKNDFTDIHAELEKNLAYFEKLEPGCTPKLLDYLDKSKFAYETSIKFFLYTSFKKLTEFFKPDLMLKAGRMNVFQSLDKYSKSYFKSDRLRKILLYTVVFLGGSPKNTPALYAIMSHIDLVLGVFYPAGGITKIPESIQKIGKSLGVIYKLNSPVSKILTESNTAIGVVVKNKKYFADIVVSNADYPFTETKLLSSQFQTYPESYWSAKTIAPSGFCLYLGINKKIKNLKHHTLFFANDWEKHFADIFKKEKSSWPQEPSYYVCTPSKTDPTVAPAGCENIFILVPVASGLKDTETIRNQYTKKILDNLEEQLGEKFQENIIYKKVFTINDYKDVYNAYQGTALGFAHNLFQSAIWRPKNKSSKLSNLYYTGQYTVPGVGLPMAVISGNVTADRIIEENI